MIDVHALLGRLAATRPVFHAEADFQLALAWQLRLDDPSLKIRLEYRHPRLPRRGYIDVWAEDAAGRATAIELKYKTRPLDVEVGAERFELLSQSAQDIGRYDTIKDLVRMERVRAAVPGASAFVVLLTNDSSYWTGDRADTVDAEFRLHEGRRLTGELRWHERASEGTRRGREAALDVSGAYDVAWRAYSDLGAGGRGEFRYALFNAAAARQGA